MSTGIDTGAQRSSAAMTHAELRAAIIERFIRIGEMSDIDSNTEAIGEATREILQQLITDAAAMRVDDPESAPAPEV